MTSEFRRKIETNMTGDGGPAISVEIDRITVFLGANGSGKSKLLKYLLQGNHSGAFDGLMPVYVEGGRVFKELQGHVSMGQHNVTVFNFPEQGQVNHVGASAQSISGRVNSLFSLLEALGENIEKLHSREVVAWQMAGKNGECPAIKPLPLDRLFEMFTAIFPNRKLSKNGSIFATNLEYGSQPYNIQDLSDGEKQVLCILADLLCINRPKSFFIVDEPELFLHPALAEKLWGLVEETFPDSYFIYATHSFAFAARPQVICRYILGYGQVSEDELWSNESEELLRPFWGGVPLLMKSKMSLLVEGTVTSFDFKFYKWILGRNDIEIVPVGSCDNVLKACNGASLWRELSRSSKLAGVVDSDFSDELSSKQNIYKLDLHEAESYLCHPDLVAFVAECLGQKKVVQTAEILDFIINSVRGELLSVVSKRVDRKLALTFNPSVSRGALKRVTSVESLVKCFEAERLKSLQEAQQNWTPSKVNSLVTREYKYCEDVIKNKDIAGILKIFEGKELLKLLLQFPGSDSDISFLSATIKHAEVKKFPHLQKLSEDLNSLFS